MGVGRVCLHQETLGSKQAEVIAVRHPLLYSWVSWFCWSCEIVFFQSKSVTLDQKESAWLWSVDSLFSLGVIYASDGGRGGGDGLRVVLQR